jgi:hypothetical protein
VPQELGRELLGDEHVVLARRAEQGVEVGEAGLEQRHARVRQVARGRCGQGRGVAGGGQGARELQRADRGAGHALAHRLGGEDEDPAHARSLAISCRSTPPTANSTTP